MDRPFDLWVSPLLRVQSGWRRRKIGLYRRANAICRRSAAAFSHRGTLRPGRTSRNQVIPRYRGETARKPQTATETLHAARV